ncbi:MAG: carboxypeptidase regulatory-like domain-containing protein [Bryobacteraceae bacterium]
MRVVLTLCLVLVLFSGEAPAQTAMGSGTVRGIVRDSYGDGLPDAVVTLSNDSLGFQRVMETTLDGVFDAPWVIPGDGYRLKVTRKEFASWQSEEFSVPSAGVVTFEIRLPELGDASREGAATGRIVEPLESGISAVVSRGNLADLPLRNRSVDTLLRLTPGVASGPQGSRLAAFGQSSGFAILVDGVTTENRLSDLAGDADRRAGADATQDAELLAGDQPAWVGGSSAGVISAATRSGGNGFHGSAYEYYRPPDWNAAERFALGQKLAGRQHQAGANLSGPMVRNRLFFFTNLEGRDTDASVLNRILDPFVADPSGSRVALSNCEAESARCAAAAAYIQPQMNVLLPAPSDSLAGVAKLDLTLRQSHAFRLAVREGRWRWPQGYRSGTVTSSGGAVGQASLEARTGYYKAGWTAVLSPFAVNDLSVGIFRDRLSQMSPAPGAAALAIRIGETSIGAAQSWRSSLREIRRTQAGEHLRFTTGGHTFQLGVQWGQSRNRIHELAESDGAYSYASLTEFARDLGGGTKNYTWFTQTFGNPARDLLIKDYVIYGQDTWHFHRFTVNLGVRWDKPSLPQPLGADTFFYQTGKIPSSSIAVGPRIGVAYAVDSDTVARFSFGHYFAPFAASLVDALWVGNGIYQTRVLVNPTHSAAPVFPAVIVSSKNLPAGTKELVYALPKLRHPYAEQTTVSIERRVRPDLWVSARYVSNTGRRLITAKDVNLSQTTVERTYSILSPGGAVVGSFTTAVYTTRTSTNYNRVFELNNGGRSSYHGLVLQARKSLWRGFHAEASYVWSHAIDDVSGPWVVPSAPASSISGNPKADRGSSNADQRHRAVLVWNWEPQAPSGATGLVRALLSGWQHSAIVVLASGLPATPLVAVRGQQFSGTTMLYTNALNGSGGWARVPFLPVNSYRAEAACNVDARLGRSIPFTEKAVLRLAIEAFNLFNSRPITGLNTTAYTALGGVLRPVAGAGSGNAAAAPRSAQLAVRLDF